jgi:hypothetical protein
MVKNKNKKEEKNHPPYCLVFVQTWGTMGRAQITLFIAKTLK